MDKFRQKSWFSITTYVLSSLSILGLLLLIAETYFPNNSRDLIPRYRDYASRWFINPNRQQLQNSVSASVEQADKLVLLINKKVSVGKSELIYRGLAGRSEFRIDVIIPELDPQFAYSHQIKIADAKNSFRLANRTYRLIYAKKAALQLKQIE